LTGQKFDACFENVPNELTEDSRLYPLCVSGSIGFFKKQVAMKRFSENTPGELLTFREEEEMGHGRRR
jgi:hypothetical protein